MAFSENERISFKERFRELMSTRIMHVILDHRFVALYPIQTCVISS